MRKCVLMLCFALFSLSVAWAQNTQEWYTGKPIKDITFKGLNTVSANELSNVVGKYRGKKFTDTIFWDLQSSLYALDYFDSIVPNALPGDPEKNSVVIEFTVEEKPVVGEIQFRGNKEIRTGDLLDVVLVKTGDLVNNSKIKIDEEAVKQHYLEKGFPDVKVTSSFEDDTKKKKKIIVFTVNEGSQTSIKTIKFSGNVFASESALKKGMESKEQSLFNSGVYQEKKFNQDLRTVEKYYRERGYIDAKVLNVDRVVERDEEENRTYLHLTIFIQEGQQYQYGGMTFKGNKLFSTEKLEGLLKQKSGGLLNLTLVDADYQKVADLYYENGYIFNTINREEKRDETNKTVSFVVNIVERGRAHIENIILKGNKKTRDFVMLRELPLEVGDVFSKTKIMEGLRNLYNLQYFSAVTPETPPGSADGLMDLVINVEESSTADIMFGLAFGGNTDFPISANVQWTDRNFLGVGETFSVNLNASPYVQSLTFSFLENWLTGRRWSGGVDFTIRHSKTTGVPQDILGPVFDGDDPGKNAFPDPYTGEYVYGSNGKPFGRKPTKEEIELYGLERDYEYAGGTTAVVPSSYLMTYETYDFSLGFNTGYRWRTPAGIFGIGTGLRTTVSFLDYDEDLYRPYLQTDRENRGSWVWTNSFPVTVYLDGRDYYFNPSSGYYLSQTVRFVGGPLQGSKHYIKTQSKAENFFTLIDYPLTDAWKFKVVFGLHSDLSFIWPQFWAPGNYSRLTAGTSDLLYVDGMYVARGWSIEYDLRSIWDNWAELRLPISEQILWLDFFFDAVGRWTTPRDFTNLRIQDFLFGYGWGLRFTIPQFPIRLYMAKRFSVDDNNDVVWRKGALFRDTLGMDFVFSIGYEIFNK